MSSCTGGGTREQHRGLAARKEACIGHGPAGTANVHTALARLAAADDGIAEARQRTLFGHRGKALVESQAELAARVDRRAEQSIARDDASSPITRVERPAAAHGVRLILTQPARLAGAHAQSRVCAAHQIDSRSRLKAHFCRQIELIVYVNRPDVVREPARDAHTPERVPIHTPALGDGYPRSRHLGARGEPPVH